LLCRRRSTLQLKPARCIPEKEYTEAIAIEYRWSEGRTERYAEIAAELVRLKVDVIVT
jgi:hypothetical protein